MADAMIARRGGQNGKVNFKIEGYNKTILESMTPLTLARARMAAATDGAGNVLFGGGMKRFWDENRGEAEETPLDLVEKYTPNGTRTTLSPLLTARDMLASAADGAGRVLFGGGKAAAGPSAIVEAYTASGEHLTLSPLTAPRSRLGAATDGAGNVLFGGGYTTSNSNVVEKYSPSGVRTTLTPLSLARPITAAAADGSGSVLFCGKGVVDRYSAAGIRTTLHPTWDTDGEMTAATDSAGQVLFTGGFNGVVDRYTKDGIQLEKLSLSRSRNELTGARDNTGNALFAGGHTYQNSYHGYYGIVECYTPAGVRTLFPELTKGRSYLKGATDGEGNAWFAGGLTNLNEVSTYVDRYHNVYEIQVPTGVRYKFREHETEQTANTEVITLKTPNEGYIKFGNVTL